MRPILTDVSQALEEPGGTIEVCRDIDLDPLSEYGVEFVPVTPAHLELSVMNSGEGLVLHGSVTVSLRTECSKCAEPFDLLLEADLDSLYLTDEQAEDLPDDLDHEHMAGETIDLAPAVLSSVRLALPYAPLHAEDCAGLCPHCGCNLNVSSCECASEVDATHPFAALADLDLEDG